MGFWLLIAFLFLAPFLICILFTVNMNMDAGSGIMLMVVAAISFSICWTAAIVGTISKLFFT